jgi:hypothetical protein
MSVHAPASMVLTVVARHPMSPILPAGARKNPAG